MKLKCLSLWQPWASLLVAGKKRVETRGWEMRHRGPLLIHAAKKWSRDLAVMCQTEPFRSALDAIGHTVPASHSSRSLPDRMPFGAIVGRVEVMDCFRTDLVSDGLDVCRFAAGLIVTPTERAFGDYSEGRFAILCANFVAFDKPIPCNGRQSLFEVDESLVRDALLGATRRDDTVAL